MLKKILFPLVAMFMLAGCATPPTTIEVSPKITLPQQDRSDASGAGDAAPLTADGLAGQP